MANITVLALDPQTGDLCFDANGMLMLREDAEAIAQNVRNNLLTWKGEFPLNTDHGTDWERVVQQPRSEAVDEADSVVRSSIFQEPYVQEISSLSMTADGRALGVEFSGVLYNGETIRVEVFLSTPSARRATQQVFQLECFLFISIHALREEGDIVWFSP